MRFKAALTALAFLTVSQPAMAAPATNPIKIVEWPVPWTDGRSRDPFAQDAETVWFVDQVNGYLVKLDTVTREFTKTVLKAGSRPHNLIVDRDGMVWYAGNRTALIGRFDPQAGTTEEFPMPGGTPRDPHTLVFDGKGHIWFTAQIANKIGRLTMESGKVDVISVPTDRARPYGIKMAPDGRVWVVLFGTSKLAKVDPKTFALTEIDLPRDEARPRRLEVTGDGRVWYGDYAEGKLGVYDPATDRFKEWDLPGGENAQPYGTASDSKGRIWLVETGLDPNRFVGFDPKTEDFFSITPIPSGGGVVRHMHYLESDGTVWFGTDFHTIGRARVEPR